MTYPSTDLARFKQILAPLRYGMLTTRALGGGLASRPLQSMQIDNDGSIWFFTSSESQKVRELRENAEVNLCYADIHSKVFVSIIGNAELIVDPRKAGSLWELTQTIFFPGGPDDPSLVLIRVVPHNVRTWDGNESALGVVLKLGKALVRGEASDLGESKDLCLQVEDENNVSQALLEK